MQERGPSYHFEPQPVEVRVDAEDIPWTTSHHMKMSTIEAALGDLGHLMDSPSPERLDYVGNKPKTGRAAATQSVVVASRHHESVASHFAPK